MFSVSDIKVCISSIEFSLFFRQSCPLCPNCGQLLDNNPFSEVKFSSLVVLLGVGSLIVYKLMADKKKRKKRLPFGFAKAINYKKSQNVEFYENVNNSSDISDADLKYKVLTSTPFVNWGPNVGYTPSISSDTSDLRLNLTDNSREQSIGTNTVAKLDLLLDQIEDIKRSVYEIDEQIFDVRESNVKFEPKMFSLVPDMSSSLTTESDLNDKFNFNITEPQTPTLEWDLTDLNVINEHNNSLISEKQLILSLNSSNYLNNQSLNLKTIDNINNESIKLNNTDLQTTQVLSSPEDLSPHALSSSTSGEFSITSSSQPHPRQEPKDNNLIAIQRMISDAKKLGLLDDLIDILIKNSKRDSAYFED